MPSTQQLRERLTSKLFELFQLDQPDLDFGFYRIMHAKTQEVQSFLSEDLLKIVEDAFGEISEDKKAKLQAKYDREIRKAERYGAPKPAEIKKVKKVKTALDATKDMSRNEADVYDHLYRFFERYYDNGDFLSCRYHTRETFGKAAPFAVPYNGEEVKLHWANSDQFYIKSAEYFSNFTFDLRQAREVSDLLLEKQTEIELGDDDALPLYVHFRIVEATEGEHGNIKAGDANKRYFILHFDNPVALTESKELVVNFEYRPDSEKSGQENVWREKRNAEAVEVILERLQAMANSGGEQGKHVAKYLRLFEVPAPTEKFKNRPLLSKYVNRYTARNTMDYFIHKDLGSFLRRELDFYIKNEVMHLDDIENATALMVESYLAKIKVLRKIAGKLINFLAQLENFQKKLWLKKKFVVETNYFVTLDRIPKEFYSEVANNDAQCEEWIRLFAIDEIGADLYAPEFSRPLTIEFLKANDKLALDTRFFDESFKARLVASIEEFDDHCDGLLIHSENFQALNLLQERYARQVKTIYIDPPYNTSASEIAYKNDYKHSSWLSLVNNSLHPAKLLMRRDNGVICCAIDDLEHKLLGQIIESNFQEIAGTVAIRTKPSGRPIPNGFAISHDYAIFARTNKSFPIARLQHSQAQMSRYKESDGKGNYFWEMFRKAGSNSNRENRPTMYYPFYLDLVSQSLRIPEMEYDDNKQEYTVLEKPRANEIEIYPIKDDGSDGCWYFGLTKALAIVDEFRPVRQKNGEFRIQYKRRLNKGLQPTTLWTDSKYSATEHGTALLKAIFGKQETFDYPKSIHAVVDCLSVSGVSQSSSSITLDYFSGSGTTGHAVIDLNRKDSGKRKFILVEMGDCFDTVLKPRIVKVAYSKSWKDGKPTTRTTGISQCIKYLNLESYEDTLNNLRFEEDVQRKKAVTANSALKEDYMLNYLLDVETRGSQSLLNIDGFTDPTGYTLKVKKPGTDEYTTRAVDLIETFNYLIGLRVTHTSVPQIFQAVFKRLPDSELPDDQHTKLVIDGELRSNAAGSWWFRKVEGWIPKDANNPDTGLREKVLIIWRKLTGDIERDNLMLDEWFKKSRDCAREFEFDIIYVNGSNNLSNLRPDSENWRVCLIEEEFMMRMWSNENS